MAELATDRAGLVSRATRDRAGLDARVPTLRAENRGRPVCISESRREMGRGVSRLAIPERAVIGRGRGASDRVRVSGSISGSTSVSTGSCRVDGFEIGRRFDGVVDCKGRENDGKPMLRARLKTSVRRSPLSRSSGCLRDSLQGYPCFMFLLPYFESPC